MGAVLAYTLTPLVDIVAAAVPARAFAVFSGSSHQRDVYRRGLAVLVVYAVIGAGLFAVGTRVIPLAADQIVQFADDLPQNIDEARVQARDWLTRYRSGVPEEAREIIDDYAERTANDLGTQIAALARNSVSGLFGAIGVLFGFLIVPFWMFYAMRDRHTVGDNFMNAVPDPARADVANIMTIGDRLLFRYIRGQLLLGLIVGTAVGVGLTYMDVQLSLALGVFAGITELIPFIGPWIGAVPGVLMVAATDSDQIIPVMALYLIVQQVENNLLVPRVQGQSVDLHPAMVILLLLVGGAVFGFIGLLFIVPLVAILRELFWYVDHRLSGADPQEAFALSHVARATEPSPSPGLIGRLLRGWRARRAADGAAAAAETSDAAAKPPEDATSPGEKTE
jgi:predicted PurR-regulated permease PerM